MKQFENKVVCITGADGGIGREISKRFAAEGATLILTSIAESLEFDNFVTELKKDLLANVNFRITA